MQRIAERVGTVDVTVQVDRDTIEGHVVGVGVEGQRVVVALDVSDLERRDLRPLQQVDDVVFDLAVVGETVRRQRFAVVAQVRVDANPQQRLAGRQIRRSGDRHRQRERPIGGDGHTRGEDLVGVVEIAVAVPIQERRHVGFTVDVGDRQIDFAVGGSGRPRDEQIADRCPAAGLERPVVQQSVFVSQPGNVVVRRRVGFGIAKHAEHRAGGVAVDVGRGVPRSVVGQGHVVGGRRRREG